MNVIIDYKVGNLASVKRGFERAKINTIVSDDLDIIKQADVLILPGVGAFKDAMNDLIIRGLDTVIKEHVEQGKFLVGICLGMQLLYDQSSEFGITKGLGLINGDITRIETDFVLPHMGWNNLMINKQDDIIKNIKKDDYVYFIHTFQAPMNEFVIAYTNYDKDVPAIVRKDNVLGMQFHPEKSGNVGLTLLQTLKEMIR